jgi:hypothetical protein
MIWGNADDPVKRWRKEADQAEQERIAAKEQMRREEERRARDVARAVARAGAHEEIAALKDRVTAIEEHLKGLDELARAVTTFSNAVSDKLGELERLLTRHAELREADSRQSKGFQFAREKSDAEPLDLPDFIRKMH